MGVQAMAPRFVFAALLFAFGIASVFATWTTLRQVSANTTAVVRGSSRG
jgi:hypothetical protein